MNNDTRIQKSNNTCIIFHLPTLYIKKLTPEAIAPVQGSKYSAGYDLAYSRCDDIIIEPGKRKLVPIDISCELLHFNCDEAYGSYYLRIAPRSSLALHHGIDVGAGVVDCDYRGPISVVLINFGENNFTIKKGDRIAQLIVERILLPKIECKNILSDTDRGDGGFGSTGRN